MAPNLSLLLKEEATGRELRLHSKQLRLVVVGQTPKIASDLALHLTHITIAPDRGLLYSHRTLSEVLVVTTGA